MSTPSGNFSPYRVARLLIALTVETHTEYRHAGALTLSDFHGVSENSEFSQAKLPIKELSQGVSAREC